MVRTKDLCGEPALKTSAHFAAQGPRVLDVILKLSRRNQISGWRTVEIYKDLLSGKYGKVSPMIEVQVALRGMAYTLNADTNFFMYFGSCMAIYAELRPGDIERAGEWAEGTACAAFVYLACYYKLCRNAVGAAMACDSASAVCRTSEVLEIIRRIHVTGNVYLALEAFPFHKIVSGVRLTDAYEIIRHGLTLHRLHGLQVWLQRRRTPCVRLYVRAANLYLDASQTLCDPDSDESAIREFKQVWPWEPRTKLSTAVFVSDDPFYALECAYGVTFNRASKKVTSI